jgi:two-component system sensor histidine kinase EvgS
MKDITDQVVFQEQLKVAYKKEIHLNKLKAAFLENMSHEIRTPLNAIVGYSEMIDECIEEKDYKTIKDLIGSFKEVMYRVLNLYGNIVEVFQIDSGELELDMVTLNVNQVLKSVYNKKSEKAEKKNLNFHLNLDDKELNIRTDWVKFERIINSLIDNAIKYTDFGDVIISSNIINEKVQITISDTGHGIKTSNILMLYEPFVQGDEVYTRKYEGAGLGLTIAYKLTVLMGGEFDINSEENIGTNIILTFPKSKSNI